MEAMGTPGNVKGKGDPKFNMVRYLGKERWITGSWEKHGILARLAKLPQWVTFGSNCFRISLLTRMLLGEKKEGGLLNEELFLLWPGSLRARTVSVYLGPAPET